MVRVHRLGLAEGLQRCAAAVGLVVAGGDDPVPGLDGCLGIEPGREDKKRVVAFGKGMSKVGAGACGIVAVVDLKCTIRYSLSTTFSSRNLVAPADVGIKRINNESSAEVKRFRFIFQGIL